MQLRSITSMKNIRGKRVLVRADHNIELAEDGSLKDDRKLRVTLPTIEFLLKGGAKVILMTHIGRPNGKVMEELRVTAVAKHLQGFLKNLKGLHVARETVGPAVRAQVEALREGEILYLENVRFHPGEGKNDPAFIRELAGYGDFYVNEAFPSIHAYEETSTCGVARLLPAYAGLALQKEADALSGVTEDPRRPLLLVIGGAKTGTKIPVIRHFLRHADHILLGGCIANTFIAARGFDVGSSRHEASEIEHAQEIMLESEKEGMAMVHVPRDVVVATEASESATKLDLPAEDVAGDMKIFDVGKVTLERYRKLIEQTGTIIWNGPLGLYELNRFSHGTKRLAEAIAAATKKGTRSIIGGGDTLDFHTRYGYPLDVYSFVSAGGGAMLEFLSTSEPLPALVPLLAKEAIAV